MTTIIKRQIEGHISKAREFIAVSKIHDLPLSCFKFSRRSIEVS